MRCGARVRADDGASLVLALVVVMLVSVGGVSLLSLAGASAKNAAITRAEVNQLYAADGGIETGIRILDSDRVNNPPTICPTVSASLFSLPSTTINSKTVSVQCRTLTGGTGTTTTTITDDGLGSALRTGYALLLGAKGLTVGGNTNGAPSMVVRGNAYSGGSFSVAGAKPMDIQGNLEYPSTCPPLPATVSLTAPGACSQRTAAPTSKDLPPTVVVPTGAQPPAVVIGSCIILYPGHYTGFQSVPQYSYYMASGTYYIDNVGSVDLASPMFGGAPGKEKQQLTTTKPCATDADAAAQSSSYDATTAGSGVEVILGGNSVLRAQSGAQVELYSRVPATKSADAAATPGVSVWGRSAAGTNYTPANEGAGFRTQDAASSMVVHGLTYLPDFVPSIREPINSQAGGASVFLGGLVALGLGVDMQGNLPKPGTASIAGTAPTSSSSTTPTNTTRKTIVCASAPTAGGATTTIEAVVTLDPNPLVAPVLNEWRTVTTC